ncbi:MAG: hypothetical protein M0T70_17025 [Geobacteraceae bacterium]|nr:hypothetical protein [Geobacteraceae bacterium]
MSTTAIVLMWVWFVAAYAVVSRWPMGKESNRRREFWARYEGK